MTDAFERAVEKEQRARAERRLRKRRRIRRAAWNSFLVHAFVYAGVNAMLFAIWLTTSGADSPPWPLYSVGFWGIGLAAHLLAIRPAVARSDPYADH